MTLWGHNTRVYSGYWRRARGIRWVDRVLGWWATEWCCWNRIWDFSAE